MALLIKIMPHGIVMRFIGIGMRAFVVHEMEIKIT